jgi:hypothetical protein
MRDIVQQTHRADVAKAPRLMGIVMFINMTTTKIIIIFALIFFAIYVIQRYPRHKLARFTFQHIGPAPRQNESESSYLVRWSLFALKWGILFFSLIFGASYLGPKYAPRINESMLFKGIFFFAIPLLLCMCILGGLYTFVLSLRLSNKKKVFSYEENGDIRINSHAGRMVEKKSRAEAAPQVLRHLRGGEHVQYVGRYHWASQDVLIVMGPIMLAVGVFSVLVEPGFVRIAILPGLPFLIGLVIWLSSWSARIVVTDQRLMLTGLFGLRSLPLSEINEVGLEQSPTGRALDYAHVILFVEPSEADPEGVRRVGWSGREVVRNPMGLVSALVTAADAAGHDIEVVDL